MRNKRLFQNKREHITHTIKAAIMDKKLWDEAIQLKEQPQLPSQPTPPNSISDIIGEDTMIYCLDRIWTEPTETFALVPIFYRPCRKNFLKYMYI